jgi:hypothetical protein
LLCCCGRKRTITLKNAFQADIEKQKRLVKGFLETLSENYNEFSCGG